MSLLRILPFTFVNIGLPSSRLHVIPVFNAEESSQSFNLDAQTMSESGLTRMRIAASDTKERSVLALVHRDILRRFRVEDVGGHCGVRKQKLQVIVHMLLTFARIGDAIKFFARFSNASQWSVDKALTCFQSWTSVRSQISIYDDSMMRD